ncbi:MAG: hypothetical protein JO043_13405 [Candidatus Eremiobacteraeota bacterium]|nr:hypothetical protein [Candidatus Eremiobacteraeota bacterium]
MVPPVFFATLLSVHSHSGASAFRGTTYLQRTWTTHQVIQPSRQGWISPAASGKALLYVANYQSPGNVEIYDAIGRNQSPIGQITAGLDGPEGMAVDLHRRLYVTNTNNNTVTVYKPGQTTPFKTYSQGMDGPAGAVVGNDGTLYVADLYSNNVVAFAHGSKVPTTIYTGLNFPIGVTLDASNNLYVTNSGSQDIIEFLSGSTQGMNLGITLQIPSGIAIDMNGDLVIANQSPAGIYVYPPGKTNPSEVFGQEGDPNPIAFLKNEKLLFVGEPLTPAVNVYAYPSGKKVNTITNGVVFPAGVAVSPRAPF